jgi:hypothetical protein
MLTPILYINKEEDRKSILAITVLNIGYLEDIAQMISCNFVP